MPVLVIFYVQSLLGLGVLNVPSCPNIPKSTSAEREGHYMFFFRFEWVILYMSYHIPGFGHRVEVESPKVSEILGAIARLIPATSSRPLI